MTLFIYFIFPYSALFFSFHAACSLSRFVSLLWFTIETHADFIYKKTSRLIIPNARQNWNTITCFFVCWGNGILKLGMPWSPISNWSRISSKLTFRIGQYMYFFFCWEEQYVIYMYLDVILQVILLLSTTHIFKCCGKSLYCFDCI